MAASCRRNVPSSQLRPVTVKQEEPEITMQHSYYAANDSLHLFLKFEDARQLLDLLQAATSYEYEIRAGSTEKDAVVLSDSLDLPGRKITDVEGQLQVRLVLPGQLVQEPNVLHFRVWQVLTGQELMGTKFRLPLHKSMLQKEYMLINATTGKPLLQNYISTADKLTVRSYSETADTIQLQRFEAEFGPAAPPMSLRAEAGPRTLAASAIYTIAPGDTLALEQEGIYLADPSTNYARGILVMANRFPEISQAREMLQPLIYLTTSEEREALLKATDTKAAIDRFWLDLAGNKAAARDLIRLFYRRVEQANRLYSSHKAGWATDRGMVYIIFGQPSSVNEVGNTITWVYRDSEVAPYIRFVFNKKENNFTGNHYELVRRREYAESWYSTIAKWRAGRINT
jgi:GWxTD domain-containing protein